MAVKLTVEPASLDKLAGKYVNEKDSNELFVKNKVLWLKNEVYGEDLEYIGNNTFQFPGLPTGMMGTLVFELSAGGGVKCTSSYTDEKGGMHTDVYIKAK